jgi:hypothetical protein
VVLGLNIPFENVSVYVLMFLVSTLFSFLSFSGIGVREYIFMQGSIILNYNLENGIAVGLMFTFLTAIVSFFGIFYHFKVLKI